MASHDDHAIEPQPSISRMDLIWFVIAISTGAFSFLFLCFNSVFLDIGKQIWAHIGWII
ncbi:MAG: hypothetical protein ACAI35_08815 [Candidatus Methylacidiphilales bacterium]|nr:hypothetical protein [Candidatus Methylacidiphilales bacterium]